MPPVLDDEYGAHADHIFVLAAHLWGYAALTTEASQKFTPPPNVAFSWGLV